MILICVHLCSSVAKLFDPAGQKPFHSSPSAVNFSRLPITSQGVPACFLASLSSRLRELRARRLLSASPWRVTVEARRQLSPLGNSLRRAPSIDWYSLR